MTWLQTFTGRAFDLACPVPESVDPGDLAHSLSMQCRFNGHCTKFYSVAEHSVRVALRVRECVDSDRVELAALLHDAHEAYIGDVAQPLKQLLHLRRDKSLVYLARGLDHAIAVRFGLHRGDFQHPQIGLADLELLATEKRDLMADCQRDWGVLPDPLPKTICPWPPMTAEAVFARRFGELLEATK